MKQLHHHTYTHLHPEVEEHQSQHGTLLKNVILGGQDGLVNVLGVILGLAASTGDVRIIVAGGLAATFAESISMAAVAYTSGLAEHDYYHAELERERKHLEQIPEVERQEVKEIFRKKGFEGQILEDIVETITNNKKIWLDTMMTEEFNLSPISKKELLWESFIVGASALVGSLIPLAPYFFLGLTTSTIIALILAAVTLFLVGVYKAVTMVGRWWVAGLQMMIIGIVAALSGYGIGLIFQVPVA